MFLSGCNLRCPYCHNVSLVNGKAEEHYSLQDILEYLEKRKNYLDGVVISGGEPTINDDLAVLIDEIVSLNLKVKLDTNGLKPDVVESLLDKLSYIAMDIKAPINRYNCFVKDEKYIDEVSENIKKSIKIISNSNVEHEFRTTCAKKILEEDDFNAMKELILDNSPNVIQRWYLQPFNPDKTLDESFRNTPSYSRDELEKIASLLRSDRLDIAVR